MPFDSGCARHHRLRCDVDVASYRTLRLRVAISPRLTTHLNLPPTRVDSFCIPSRMIICRYRVQSGVGSISQPCSLDCAQTRRLSNTQGSLTFFLMVRASFLDRHNSAISSA